MTLVNAQRLNILAGRGTWWVATTHLRHIRPLIHRPRFWSSFRVLLEAFSEHLVHIVQHPSTLKPIEPIRRLPLPSLCPRLWLNKGSTRSGGDTRSVSFQPGARQLMCFPPTPIFDRHPTGMNVMPKLRVFRVQNSRNLAMRQMLNYI